MPKQTKAPPLRKTARPARTTKATSRMKVATRVKEATRRKPGPMFEKVAFTMFSVVDPKRARAFYENVLGLTRGLASPDGTWTEYDLPGGGCIALFRHPNPAHARPPGGGTSVALEVADLDALNAQLIAAGVTYTSEIVHGPHCRMSNILDSEGNAIILHELASKR